MVTFIKGDILEQDVDMIAHQVNTIGIMGAGLAAQISTKYPEAVMSYKQFCTMNKNNDIIGEFIPCKVYNEKLNKRQLILNCFTQRGVNLRNERHTDLEGIKTCFNKIKEEAKHAFPNGCTLAIPYKYGCGLADGNWDEEVLPLFVEIFGNEENINLFICKYFD